MRAAHMGQLYEEAVDVFEKLQAHNQCYCIDPVLDTLYFRSLAKVCWCACFLARLSGCSTLFSGCYVYLCAERALAIVPSRPGVLAYHPCLVRLG